MTETIPAFCEHNAGEFFGKVRCIRGGHVVWTECTSCHWGEPPVCAYVEPDNSEAACARRLRYMRQSD